MDHRDATTVPTVEAARGRVPWSRPLLGLLLLPIAASPGCRSMDAVLESARRAQARAQADANGLTNPMVALSPEPAPTTPTDPEPLPELTSERTASVHLDLGRVFDSRGQVEAAEGEYRAALAAVDRKVDRETQAEIHRRLAASLDRRGKFADSAEHHQAATRLAPRDARPWNDAGYSAYLQGDWDEAVRLLRQAEAIAPDDARILTNLGLALAASDRRDEAIAAFSRAGGPSAAQANLAYILAATGRTDEARDSYRKALELNPGHALARTALARLDAVPDADADTVAAPTTALASRPSPVAPASFEPIVPPPIPMPPSSVALPPMPR